MAESTIDPALINAGANVLTTGANIAAQANLNRKTRKWNEEMYERQKQDSYNQWVMQNEFNSPTSQMARLKDAGLNPNLVYGNGSAVQTASPIQKSSVANWSPTAPNFSPLADSIFKYQDYQMRKEQVDLLKKQNTVATQEALLKSAQTYATLQTGARSQFDLGLAHELKNFTLEAASQNVRNMKQSYDIGLADHIERILVSKLGRDKASIEINNLQKSGRLMDLDIALQNKGLQKTDSLPIRVMGQVVDQLTGGKSIGSIVQYLLNLSK